MLRACITGDVHHYLGGPSIKRQEAKFALEYLNIVEKYNAKATLFVTGKSIEQHRSFWKKISVKETVELGAHTYSALKPQMIHAFFKMVFGSSYGPYFYQYLDIRKTLKAFKKIGKKPKAWRTHSYASGSITFELLEKFGFTIVSDIFTLGHLKILKTGKLMHIGITAPPDDNIIKFYFEGKVEQMKLEGEKIKAYIFNLITERKEMLLQLHPLSMKVFDNFKTFEEILRKLVVNNYSFCTITQMVEKSKVEDISYLVRLARPSHVSIPHSCYLIN